MTKASKPIEWKQVEALRRHMLLSIKEMATLLDVSRPTYYAWLAGTPPRARKDKEVRLVLKKLLAIITDYQWPAPEILALDPPERFKRLCVLLGKTD